LKLWNTMPSSMRSLLMSVLGALMSCPSTMMVPASTVSSLFMERSSVLLPEPEGPMMTTFSPRLMDRDTLFSALSAPKFLCTWLMSTMV